jgi:hypothetical protein
MRDVYRHNVITGRLVCQHTQHPIQAFLTSFTPKGCKEPIFVVVYTKRVALFYNYWWSCIDFIIVWSCRCISGPVFGGERIWV